MEEVSKHIVSHEDNRQCLVVIKSNIRYETRRHIAFDIYVLPCGSFDVQRHYCYLCVTAEIEHDDPAENYIYLQDIYSARVNHGDGSYAVRCLYSLAYQIDAYFIEGFISWVDTGDQNDPNHAARLKGFWEKMGFCLTPKEGFGETYDIRSDKIGDINYVQKDFVEIRF